MYYTGIDPMSGKKVPITDDPHKKQLQRALLQSYRPENAPLVREALRRVGREDLIGYGRECLVRPENHGGHDGARSERKTGGNTRDDRRDGGTQSRRGNAPNPRDDRDRQGDSRDNRQRDTRVRSNGTRGSVGTRGKQNGVYSGKQSNTHGENGMRGKQNTRGGRDNGSVVQRGSGQRKGDRKKR